MTRSEFRSSVIRILKTRTGPVGRALIRGCRSLLCTARPYFSRPEIAVPVPDVQSGYFAVLLSKADRAGGPRVPSERRFRVLFVVRPGPSDANSTRFRGFDVMEALRLTGVPETDHLDDRRIPELLEEILLFDLVVLVRRRMSPEIHQLLEFAEKSAIPVICDLDDYLFDEEVIPCSDFLMGMPLEQAREMIHQFRELILRAGYYTGATDLLRENGRPCSASRATGSPTASTRRRSISLAWQSKLPNRNATLSECASAISAARRLINPIVGWSRRCSSDCSANSPI